MLIDGVDVRAAGLKQLRSGMAMIPQARLIAFLISLYFLIFLSLSLPLYLFLLLSLSRAEAAAVWHGESKLLYSTLPFIFALFCLIAGVCKRLNPFF